MRIKLISLFLAAMCAGAPLAAAEPGAEAQFAWISYAGQNPADAALPVRPGHYRNPIIPGFHPDPSIVRVGRDYYLVNSTFAYYPGLPIFHSRNLVDWQQLGNAVDRPDMVDFTGLGVSRGLFAPTLRFHDGLYYLINTCIDCGFNYLITAKNPAGPWSKPVFLPSIDGIDPDLFFDSDGRAWIANNGPPIGPPQYDGHRAIWIQEYDPAARKMIGARQLIINGGVDFSQKPIWTEGPHIFKHNGWYYLIAAEGGTAGNHSETVFRSKAVTGPYVPGPRNPILTQRDLDSARAFPVYATGHADFVQTPAGHWWAVFLGTRPYENNLSSMGRETFLLPVTWVDGWPQILPPRTLVDQSPARPNLPASKSGTTWSHWRDEFDRRRLAPDWVMLRTPNAAPWVDMTSHPGSLTLKAQATGLAGTGNPSFLAKRQRHARATIETELSYTPGKPGDCAGLAIFSDAAHHYFFGVMHGPDGPQLVVTKRDGQSDPASGTRVAAMPFGGHLVRLRLTTREGEVDFSYALPGGAWRPLLAHADARMLASERSNQFTGVVIGAFAARGQP